MQPCGRSFASRTVNISERAYLVLPHCTARSRHFVQWHAVCLSLQVFDNSEIDVRQLHSFIMCVSLSLSFRKPLKKSSRMLVLIGSEYLKFFVFIVREGLLIPRGSIVLGWSYDWWVFVGSWFIDRSGLWSMRGMARCGWGSPVFRRSCYLARCCISLLRWLASSLQKLTTLVLGEITSFMVV